jgi:penicillin-binding protein 2
MARGKSILRSELISRRTFLIGAGNAGLLSLLFGRLVYIQLFKQKEYKTLSEKNRISIIITPPIRGNIYDIEGREVAINKPCFRLLLDRSNNPDYQKEIIQIQEILALDEAGIAAVNNKIQTGNKKLPIMILDNLSWGQIASIEECKNSLSSIFVDKSEIRFYPFGQNLSHLIGYTGRSEQRNSTNLLINNADFNVGKTGIEKYYEEPLRGNLGFKQMEVNAYGKYIRLLTKTDSTRGQDINLNIDAQLHAEIIPMLSPQGASAMVMNIHTGNMLIMASTPNFEPNNFYKLTNEYWQNLVDDPYKPLVNKMIHSAYPPGSVFKLITILAALDAGISPDKIISCSGESMLGGKYFRCHAKQGHGPVDMNKAIKYSCNSYMYQIGRLIGADKIIAMAAKFGFGSATGIDLPSECTGLLPSKDWKKTKYRSNWTIADTMNLSIGQGFLLASPLQITRFITAIANKGKLLAPQVMQHAKNEIRQIDIEREYFDILHSAMYEAVNTPGGTAYYSRILDPDRQLAGKTGTVQVQSKTSKTQDLNSMSVDWERRNHAVFIGFAPFHAPKYAISVFVDHGGGGGRAAAPIASKIMNLVLDKYSDSSG